MSCRRSSTASRSSTSKDNKRHSARPAGWVHDGATLLSLLSGTLAKTASAKHQTPNWQTPAASQPIQLEINNGNPNS
eukprot:3174075-Amphidinium_carterae.4